MRKWFPAFKPRQSGFRVYTSPQGPTIKKVSHFKQRYVSPLYFLPFAWLTPFSRNKHLFEKIKEVLRQFSSPVCCEGYEVQVHLHSHHGKITAVAGWRNGKEVGQDAEVIDDGSELRSSRSSNRTRDWNNPTDC